MPLPPCGLYRTLVSIGGAPAGSLVFFHNHGDPGPGIYLPAGWEGNRARFAEQGIPLPDLDLAEKLEPLPAEGLYRVTREFWCCEKHCRRFEPDLLVQLGYNGAGEAIVFVPEWWDGTLAFPERGFPVDRATRSALAPLKVAPVSRPPEGQLH